MQSDSSTQRFQVLVPDAQKIDPAGSLAAARRAFLRFRGNWQRHYPEMDRFYCPLCVCPLPPHRRCR